VKVWTAGFAILLCLFGCGGSSSNQTSQPVDETLQRETNAGQTAFKLERPEEAIARYQDALKRAQARDDLGQIGDLGYNLAVAELEANHPRQALEVARSTEQELQRRGSTPFAGLTLVEATALYRTGDLNGAYQLAGKIDGTNDKDAAARASFLRGLISDERGDTESLASAAQSLKSANSPSLQADSAELAARLSLRRRNFAEARREAEHAAALRQQSLDYRGLARALALGGEAASRAADAKGAADLFLRAGRSAAAQGDKATARIWLQQAADLATDESVRSAANELLAKLSS
jgi:tetratricopeptide (TPR) repeat protein